MAIRTYGLSGSGIDVDQMVKDLMKAQQIKYDKLAQKKTQLEWKKADYNAMYTTLSDLRNTVFNYKLQATLSPKTAAVSNGDVVSVSATADAVNVTHSLTVSQLAAGVTKTSSAAITTGASKDSLVNQFGIAADTFTIKITNGGKSGEITVDPTKSIYELVSSINNAGLNVKASYDAVVDRFFLYSTNSGSDAGIDFAGSSAAGLDFLANNLKINTNAETGKNAEFVLDGAALSQKSNTFTIAGVSYSLKGVGAANISVSSDTAKTVENVKAFVEAYNKALDKINGELKEAKYKDFLPLTESQKKEMKENEIKAWEEKARSGLLRGDSILRDAVMNLRSSISSPVSGLTGKYTSLSSIGIKTGDYTENGKLYLDENKLKAALEEQPDVLSRLFATSGTGTAAGVAVRLYDNLKAAMDKVVGAAGVTPSLDGDTKSALAKEIRTYVQNMDTLKDRMADMEKRYYKKFDAMESALNRLSQQNSWLMQQFSSK